MLKFKDLRLSVILVPGLIFIAVVIAGAINSKQLMVFLNTQFERIMVNFGWLISIGMLVFIGFMVFLIFHPLGKIRLGGEKAKPKFTRWQWFTVSLISGIGTGIVFWGSVEPLLFFMEPAPSLGLEPGSNAAKIWAMSTTFMHWSFTPYAIYVTFGVILAYVYHNMKKEANVSSGFIPLMGDRAGKGMFASFIDALTVFAIIGGIAGSFGWGLLQIGEGFNLVFNIEPTTFLYFSIAAAIMLVYTLSSISGLQKGILFLSDKNAWVFIGLMLVVFIFGPTAYIMNLMTEATGSFLSNFVQNMTYTAPFPDGELWPQRWDMYWWTDWLSFAPIMGLFFMRLAYGRTIREFVIVNWMLPALFGILWFSIFGGTVLFEQAFGTGEIYDFYKANGEEALTFATFDLLTFGTFDLSALSLVLKTIMLVTVGFSFITMTDSMVSTVSTMSMKNNAGVKEAPIALKIFWGVLIAASSLVFMLSGGIGGIKTVKTFAGFPILFIGLFMLIGFLRYMKKRPRTPYGQFVYEDALLDEDNEASDKK